MTESDYILKEVREAKENVQEALCHGSVTSYDKVLELRGHIKAFRSIESFIVEYQKRRGD